MSRKIEPCVAREISEIAGQVPTRWVITEDLFHVLEVRLEYKGWLFWRKLERLYPEFRDGLDTTEAQVAWAKKRIIEILVARWRKAKDRQEFFK